MKRSKILAVVAAAALATTLAACGTDSTNSDKSSGASGGGSTDTIASKLTLGASSEFQTRADGVPGLRTVYGAKFDVSRVEDPVQRAARLTDGQAAIGAFRRTEYTGASGLVELVDVEKIAVPDPGVVLVNSKLTDAEPDHVLAINAVAQALTTDVLVDLQAQVAAGGSVTDVAGRWLKEQGLA